MCDFLFRVAAIHGYAVALRDVIAFIWKGTCNKFPINEKTTREYERLHNVYTKCLYNKVKFPINENDWVP